MARLIWSPRALRDVDEIAEYIARDSERYAQALVQRIMDAVRRIPDQPWAAGRVAEDDCDTLRERFVGNYRVIYRIRADLIELVTVVHAARALGEGSP